METNYREMWTDLGLNLDTHDALLGALSDQYQKIFLTLHLAISMGMFFYTKFN